MNTLKNQLLAVATLLLLGSSALAADDTDISIRKSADGQQTLVRVCNLSEGTAVLRLKDAQGHVLHREAIKNHAYMKKYDLANLPSGDYTIEVRSHAGLSQETFTLSRGEAHAMYFKPAIRMDDATMSVQFRNSVASPVSLKLHDRYGKVLYQETVAPQAEFAKGLNLSKLKAGQYSLSITGDDYVYSKSIALKQ